MGCIRVEGAKWLPVNISVGLKVWITTVHTPTWFGNILDPSELISPMMGVNEHGCSIESTASIAVFCVQYEALRPRLYQMQQELHSVSSGLLSKYMPAGDTQGVTRGAQAPLRACRTDDHVTVYTNTIICDQHTRAIDAMVELIC